MGSLFAILQVARSAVVAQQTAVRVASQNIANAEVEGYTRQRAALTTSYTVALPLGVLGNGVQVDHIARVRDQLQDATYRQSVGRAAATEIRHQLLDGIQQVFGEPSDAGLAVSLDAFHSAWADLANQPGNSAARSIVYHRGQHLANTFRSFSARLDDNESFARMRLVEVVDHVNRLGRQIAAANEEIVRAEAGGGMAPDLRDKRDLLIDSLAKLGSVRLVEREVGGSAVYIDGAKLVDGADTTELTLSGSPPQVRTGSRVLTFEGRSSALGELVETLSVHVPATRQRLDTLASALVEQVNALHSSGYTLAGTTGVNFFDPAGVTANSINVTVPSSNIVSSDRAGESGNNNIAAALAALKDAPGHNLVAARYPAWAAVQNNLSGLSFAEHYRTTVVEIGTLVNDAESYRTIASTLASQAHLQRASVSGVSTDEELILVMQHQQAYAAAARVISVVDEMIRTIIDLR
jgi:flagellar hook-associated protein 1